MPDMNSARVAQPGGYPPARFYAGQSVVPDLVGHVVADIAALLAAADMVAGAESSEWVSIANDGKITAQAPVAGVLALNGSAVTYRVGHKATVPDLVGTAIADVAGHLTAAGLILGTNTPGAGTLNVVVGQSPAAGTFANAGAAVNITLGNGA
jgi:beta-lactam-binding protein with PASTA domain